MRWLVWSLCALLLSCGKSSSSSDGAHANGPEGGSGVGGTPGVAAGTGGTSPMAAGNGGSGARAGMSSGGSSAAGGAINAGAAGLAPSGGAGGAPSGGVGGAPSAGSSAGGDPPSGASGSAGLGDAGAGNAPAVECDGMYLECGCGCCVRDSSSPLPGASCYYPELGDTLEDIKAKDAAAALDSSCASAGCSYGAERHCCVTPVEVGPAAAYEATGYSGDVDHFSMTRTDENDRCTKVMFAAPSRNASELPLHLPMSWGLEAAGDCGGRSDSSRTIGVMGSLEFIGSDPCTASFDFTVFLLSEGGEVEAVRFQGEADVPGLLWCNGT